MPEPTANDAAELQDTRSSRGLGRLGALFALIFVPAGIYALYVFGQLDYIREHNLRGLDSAAQAAASLLENTRTNVDNLIEEPAYACTFFQRQTLLHLVTPECGVLKGIRPGSDALQKKLLRLDTSRSTVEIAGFIEFESEEQKTAAKCSSPPAAATGEPAVPSPACALRIEIVLGKVLEQIPFGAVFDQLLVVDDAGALLGSAISPQRNSPMLPPRVTVGAPAPPVRALDLAKLKFVGDTKDKPINFAGFGSATFVHPVELGGTRYTLMCQPWRVAAGAEGTKIETWRLCGLIDGQRSFQQALEVAPHVVMVLLVLLTLAIVSWPLLKVLSLAPSERLRFADMYLMLLATLTLAMIFAVAVADVGSYADLRERSRERLQTLARQIESNLRAEFEQMYRQLRVYDAALSNVDPPENSVRAALSRTSNRIGCLLLPPNERKECQGSAVPLDTPHTYEHFQSVFWMRPCDGLQIVKGAVRASNTPAISLATRTYFQAVKRDRFWRVSAPADAQADAAGEDMRFFVDTSASITTGEFFAALAIPSQLNHSDPLVKAMAGKPDHSEQAAALDCRPPEDERFGAALTGQPVSVRYPVLAPGVGFAIADQDGRVLFHSDERRAVAFENLLTDEGLADRVRAALAARSEAQFYAQYQTRPHQIHIRPMRDIPWSVMTFADDEILRTLHVELLAQTGILMTLYLLLAFVGTLIYILFHGRVPPPWVWPRRERLYRGVYCATVWSLVAQLILFLLALDLLRGETLIVASVLLPLPALITVVVASGAAQRIRAPTPNGVDPAIHRTAVENRQRWISALLVVPTGLLVLAAIFVMNRYDPVAAGQVSTGTETWILCLLLAAVIVIAAVRRLTNRVYSSWVRWWRDPLGPHIIATAIIWLVLGALPAYGFYKFALGTQMTVVAKSEQSYLGRALAWRGCQIRSDFRLIPTAKDSDAMSRRIDMSPPAGGRSLYSDIYPSALLSRDVAIRSESLDATTATGTTADEQVSALPFWEYLVNVAPVYNETTMYSRYLGPFVAPHLDAQRHLVNSRWSWQVAGDAKPMLVYEHGDASECGAAVPTIASRLPMFEPHFGWTGVILSLAFLSLLFSWVSFGTRKLFFGDIEEQTRQADSTADASVDLTSDHHLGSLTLPPDMPWALAEVAPIYTHFSEKTLQEWCDEETRTTRRAVVDRILAKVGPYYETRWKECSEEEKLLLIQLVEEGFANPKQAEVVRRLLKAGLLRLDPVLRPMNQSFAVFVEAHAQPEKIRKQEQAHRGLRWSLVRSLLLAALVLIMLFLALTQRDVIEVWIAYLGTAAAGTVGVLKLLGLLNRPGAQKVD